MQSPLGNTMTLSCSCLLKRGEARWQRHFAELGQWRWQRTKTHYKPTISAGSANPAGAVFILVQFSAANAKGAGQTQSKTNRRLSLFLLLVEAKRSAPIASQCTELVQWRWRSKKRHKLMISACFAQHTTATTVLILVQFFATLSAEQQNMTHSFYVSL